MTGVDKHTLQDISKRFRIKENEPLKRHTSFRVGGPADLFATPETPTLLEDLVKTAAEAGIPVFILGGGTNILFRDKGFRGLVICLSELNQPVEFRNNDTVIMTAPAGVRLNALCRKAIEQGLTGLEFAAGIPGTFGGSLYMNAGAHGGSITDRLISIRVMEKRSGQVHRLHRDDLQVNYRKLRVNPERLTVPMSELIILEADLALETGDPEQIRATFETNLEQRNRTQPVAAASAGCFFKNPSPEKPAGKLIELCGLKGTRIGGAQVSQKHANYIVNHEDATCADILDLVAHVRQQVKTQFDVELETEVKIEGE
ncbi:MAG: UDP-N-acetylmuramate dehydrogenase [Desulfobacteraceae bacterium]|nr:MAG: UDP-N-acetylmuramate dehydrogenase [Desulfobacteraceae bacterium]